MSAANERQAALVTSLTAARDAANQRALDTQEQLAALTDSLGAMATNYATLAPLIGGVI